MDSNTNNYPMTPSGVGFASHPTRWIYSEYGQFLSAYNYVSGIEIVFNLNSPDSISSKLNAVYALRERGQIPPDDVSELEERLRTCSTLCIGGNDDQSLAGLQESVKHAKGKEYYTYSDGVKKKHIARGSSKHSSEAQKKAAENARKYAWSESARTKRRKSISARGDGKITKEI